MSQNRQGHIYAIVAAVLFGASTPAAKGLLGEFSPWLLAGLLYIGSGGGLFGAWLARSWWRSRHSKDSDSRAGASGAPLRRGDWRWVAGSTVFGGLLAPLLLVFGLNYRDSASAALLLNTEGVLTAAIAWMCFHERSSRGIAFSWVAILSGSLILGWSGAPGPEGLVGSLCILGSCLSWAIDNNLSKRIADRDVLQFTTIKGLVAGVTNTALALTIGGASVSALSGHAALVAAAVIIGFFGYGVGLLSFILGLRHLGAARTAAYFSASPFIGAGLALLLGQSQLTWQIATASALMAGGLVLHFRAERRAGLAAG